MKPTTLLLIFTFFAMPGIVYAESPFSSLQSAKEKTTVLQDLRKICTPQASLSDEAWEKLMLSDENNKLMFDIRDQRDQKLMALAVDQNVMLDVQLTQRLLMNIPSYEGKAGLDTYVISSRQPLFKGGF